MPPRRPASVPATATYDAEHASWCDGVSSRANRKQGVWTYWHRKGEPMGRVAHDAQGERHGPHRWLHANGELQQEGRYEHGHLEGKVAWVRPTGKLPAYFKWFDRLGTTTCRFEVAYLRGEQQDSYFTLYNAAGRDAPIATNRTGRSINLGRHMHKVQPETVLYLVENDFERSGGDGAVHAGSIARLARGMRVARGRYVYAGSPFDGVHQLRFVHADGAREEFFVETAELDRAFTLAADYFFTAAGRVKAKKQPAKPKVKSKAKR